MKTNMLQTIVVILVMVAAALAGMSSLAMPAVVPDSAPAGEFSAERAMEHVRAISQKPHPSGSPENARVRDYILSQLRAQGLSPEIQQTTAVAYKGGFMFAIVVENIVASIPGTNSSGAIALDAHYDTRSMTPGASDCGSCVATLLETARALQAGPPLQNDVILLFTDSEEFGPVGAPVFVEEHPWAKEVQVVLNFDSAGRTGPSMVVETGPHSGWLVREWGRTVPLPAAQSWLDGLLQMTGFDTDIRSFAEAGKSGLNFIYFLDETVYHTLLDNPETIDPRSLQHDGSNALEMTRFLGDLDLAKAQSPGDAIYFTLFRGLLVSYPATWALPLVLLVGLLLAGTAVVGFRQGQLNLRSILLGLAAGLLSVIAIPGLATGLWMGILRLHTVYQSAPIRTYNYPLYYWAFVALAVAIAAVIHVLFRPKAGASNLAFGALLLWWILAAAFSVLAPGLSYLLTWPLLFSTLALGWVLWRAASDANSWPREMALVAGVVPGLIIVVPAIRTMSDFGPISFLAIPFLFVALLLGLLTPQLDLMTRARRWRLSGGALLVSLGFLVAGSLTAGFDAKHPQSSGIAYFLNADAGQAKWFSPGPQLDRWTTQFFDTSAERGSVGELYPIARFDPVPVLHGPAPAMALDASEVEVLNDQTENGVRTLHLRLRSPRQAPIILLDVEPRAAVRAAVVAGQRNATPASDSNVWSLEYRGVPPEGIEITLEIEPSQLLTLQVIDISWELPGIVGTTFQPRPDDMMPMPNFDYGAVVVRIVEIP